MVDRERRRKLLFQARRFEVSELQVEPVAAMAARAGIDRARSSGRRGVSAAAMAGKGLYLVVRQPPWQAEGLG